MGDFGDDGPRRRATRPFARWSADTEQAFPLALKLTGQATKAAPMKKLDAIERKRKREAAEAQERDWARWRACWAGWGVAGVAPPA